VHGGGHGAPNGGQQAVEEARRLAPQVILMDLKMPGLDGVAATRAILAEQRGVGIVILTSTEVEDDVLAVVEAGALGYLAKSSPREDFLAAIRTTAAGEPWLPAPLTHRLMSLLKPRPPVSALTDREREVLDLLAQGWRNRRIARELKIREVTIRTHVSHVFDKLGVASRVEATLHALRSGLVRLQEP
jgi:DNA-binding NarL/FixJ family response regulator